MRYGVPALAVVLLLLGCGGEPGVTRAEHEALLQRLDAMDQRLDALEEAIARPPTPSDRPATAVDPFGVVAPIPLAADVIAEPSPTLSVRITLAGIEIDGKALTREDAERRFREVARRAPSTRLMVVTDPGVPHGSVVDALDLAREAGLTEVALSARMHGEGAPP